MEWIAIPFSRGSSWLRDWTRISCIAGRFFTIWTTRKGHPSISVQFSNSRVSLRPPWTQHARPPCPSPTPSVHLNPCPLSQWCHSTISSSVVPFSSCPQSFPASGSFQMSQLFASGGESIRVSASTSVISLLWITSNCRKFWEMEIPDHLTCLLRNLYAGQEATVRTGHGTTDWFQIGKGVRQSYILSPCLFNFYEEYIMRNSGLEEA